MAEVSDITVYQKLAEIADDLDELLSHKTSIVSEAGLSAASKTIRGIANVIYKRIMSEGDETLHN